MAALEDSALSLEGSGATFEHVKEGRKLELEDNLKEEILATVADSSADAQGLEKG